MVLWGFGTKELGLGLGLGLYYTLIFKYGYVSMIISNQDKLMEKVLNKTNEIWFDSIHILLGQ